MNKLLEKDVEDYIISFTDWELFNKGLLFNGKLKRQVTIKGYGVADLIAIKKNYTEYDGKIFPYITITVFELKKDKINTNTYFQDLRYCYGIKEYLESRNFYVFDFEIVLVGKSIANCQYLKHLKCLTSNHCFSAGCVKNLTTYEYIEDGNGLYFNFK